MSEIKRYCFEQVTENDCEMVEDAYGQYVTFDDHESRIKQLAQQVTQLEQELEEAKKQGLVALNDQARYLKLIETGNFSPTRYSGLWGLHMSGKPYTKAELDAPIDKALAAIKESK